MTPASRGRQAPKPARGRLLLRWLVAWVRLMRKYSVSVLAFSLLSALLTGWYTASHFSINTSTADMLSPDLPFQRQFAVIDEIFPQDYRTIIIVVDAGNPEQAQSAARRLAQDLEGHADLIRNVFYPEGDPFFRRHGLLFLSVDELQQVGSMLAGAQPLLAALSEDPSLRGLARVLTLALDNIDQTAGPNGGLPPQFEASLDGIAKVVEGVRAGHPAPFSWRAQFAATDGPPHIGGTRQLILLEPAFDFSSLQPAERAIQLIRATASRLGLSPENGVRVRLTGEPVMMEEELATVEKGIGIANIVALGVVLALLVVGFRSGCLVEATMFSLLVGLAWTAFFAVAAVGELNLISVAFAVLFIGFGVDFGIHVSMRAKEYIDAEIGPGLAIEEAAAGTSPGLTLTTLCASIGFLSFVPTAYQGLIELGIISSVGMVVALVTSLSIVPAYLAVRTPGRSDVRSRQVTNRALETALRRRARPIVWGSLALGVAATAALPFVRFDDLPLNLRDPSTEGVATLYDLIENGRFDPFRAVVLAPDEKRAVELANRLRALPEVGRVETAADLVPDRQDEKLAMLGDLALLMAPVLAPGEQSPPPDPAALRKALADLRRAAAAVADRSPGARRLADALGTFDASDASLTALQSALIVNLKPLLSELNESLDAGPVEASQIPAPLRTRRLADDGRVLVEIFPRADLRDERARRHFAAAVQSVAPEASGEAILVTEGGAAVITSFVQAGVLTFLAIAVVLLVVLRSLRDSLIVMAPLILAGLLTVSTGVVIGQPFNFANVIVLPLLFGLGVSSGINMAVRGRQQGHHSLFVTSTPRAVLFSALTTIGSFGSLFLSPHPGTSSMGLLLMIALTYSTLCMLIMLPALRFVFGQPIHSQKYETA